MEPMMVEAVLGPRYETADSALLHRVSTEVCALINRTTGVQTLVQMKTLIDLIRQSGFVPENQILDEHGYLLDIEAIQLLGRRCGCSATGTPSTGTSCEAGQCMGCAFSFRRTSTADGTGCTPTL